MSSKMNEIQEVEILSVTDEFLEDQGAKANATTPIPNSLSCAITACF